jgi:hypothetical protein
MLTPVIATMHANTTIVNYGPSSLLQNFTFMLRGKTDPLHACLALTTEFMDVLARARHPDINQLDFAVVFRYLGLDCITANGFEDLWGVVTAPQHYYHMFGMLDSDAAAFARDADAVIDVTGPTQGHKPSLIAETASISACHTPFVGYLGFPGSFGEPHALAVMNHTPSRTR